MTTLSSILVDRLLLIEQKEDIIRQLQDEIAQHRVWVQAGESVSSTLDSAKELFYNAMTSLYSLMQHESEEARQAAVEKVWDDFEKLDTQAREHVANRRALPSDSEEVFENQFEEIPSEFETNFSDNPSDTQPETTITVVGEPVDSDSASVSEERAPEVFEENHSDSEETVSDSPRTVVEQLSDTFNNHRPLTADELKKDKVNWQALKALAASKGVTAKKRPEIEAALLELGVTDKDLWEVRLEF